MREIHNVKRDSLPQFPAPGLRPVSYLIYLPPHFIREYSEGPSIVPDTEDRLNNCFLNELINRQTITYLQNYMYHFTTCFSIQLCNLATLSCGSPSVRFNK